jgi:hypothetical protein
MHNSLLILSYGFNDATDSRRNFFNSTRKVPMPMKTTSKILETTPEQRSQLAMSSEIQSAAVMQSYQKNVMGSDVDFEVLVKGIMDTCTQVNGGNLQTMEAMLVSQATALQTIFTDLARKAQAQTYQKQFEVYLGLALKAQAQSRATISALVDLKYPRQATFVKQANIAHGPQQVNNGVMPSGAVASRGKKQKTEQNKLLEESDGKLSSRMDIREAAAPESGHQGMEALEPVHRTKNRGGQIRGVKECV